MNSEEFILIIRDVVRNRSIEDTIENLKSPPGRGVSLSEKIRSEWFNGLEDREKNLVESIISDAVDESVFGFLAVIDGVRAIEDGTNKGRLELIYKGETDKILNNSKKIYLHDLYNMER